MRAGFTKHIALLIISLTAISATAQVMMPSAQSNRTEMLIGEQAEITLSLELTLQDEWPQIAFPYQQDTLVEGLEVVEVTPVDTIRPDEANQQLYKLSQQYTVTSFDSGFYQIKPFPIVVDRDTLFSNRLSLAVNTLQVDTTKTSIFDIKDIYEVELTWQDYLSLYWWIGAIVLGVVALAILAFYFWKQRQKRPATPVEKPKPKIPPHEIALAALQQLESDKAWEKSELKVYHTDVTDILRDYIEARYMVPAHEQTSNEVLQNLRFVDMSQEATIRLRHVLKLADMVKFAKEKPGPSENKKSLDFAREFVQNTKLEQRPEPEPEAQITTNSDEDENR